MDPSIIAFDPSEYPYLRAWGKMMGSYSHYILAQARQAKVDNAPQDAIYKRDCGEWATFDNIVSENTRGYIQKLVDALEKPADGPLPQCPWCDCEPPPVNAGLTD